MAKSTEWTVLNKRIRAAEKAAAMTRADHEDVVLSATGKASLGDCNVAEMRKVFAAIEARHPRPFKASHKGYVRKIFALWGELGRQGAIRATDKRAALVSYVNRMAGTKYRNAGQLSWLTPSEASPIIEALKDWLARLEQPDVA